MLLRNKDIHCFGDQLFGFDESLDVIFLILKIFDFDKIYYFSDFSPVLHNYYVADFWYTTLFK